MLIALLAAAVVAGSTNETPARHGWGPEWARVPSDREMAEYLPEKTLEAGINGGAVLGCAVAASGRITQCHVIFEAPEKLDYGTTALKLAPLFRMKVGAVAIGSSRVTIPIEWGFDAPDASAGVMIANPVWLSAASFADVAAAYPAASRGESGGATLRCRVNQDGWIGLCGTLEEQPPGDGFAAAARALTDRFRIALTDDAFASGKPMWTDVKFRFVDPDSAAFRARLIAAPKWTATPSAAELTAVYPAVAAAKGVKSGRGVAQCVIAADGALSGCKPLPALSDEPGFSQAAAIVASGMRMNPWTDDGGPVDGATINLPIRFEAPTPSLGAK